MPAEGKYCKDRLVMLKALQTSSAVSLRTVVGWAEREWSADTRSRRRKVRLQLFIGARFHKDAIHNAEGLGDFCVKDVQDNPSLQKTIPMSAPDRSSPLKGKNDRR